MKNLASVTGQSSTFHDDADATNELPSAERTMDDLGSEPAADATGEVSIEDVLEVIAKKESPALAVAVAPAPDASMSAVFGAITPKKLRELTGLRGALRASPAALDPTAPPAPPPPPSPLSLVTSPPVVAPTVPPAADRSPSYVAEPVVYDIAPAPVAPTATRSVAARALLESTAEIQWFAGVPQRTPWQHVVTGFAGAIAASICALVLVARTLSPASQPTEEPASATASAVASPGPSMTTVVQGPVHEVALTPEQVAAPEPAVTVLQTTSEMPVVAVGALPNVPDATPAPAAPSHGTAGRSVAARGGTKGRGKGAVKTGQVTMPSGVQAALVDGAPKKVVNGSLALTCGPHKIKFAMRPARTVDVPCGGTTSF